MRIANLLLDDPVAAEPEIKAAPVHPRESIVTRFARVAATYPTRPAVADESGQWTYAELRAEAGRIARYIHGLGLAPETPVGLLFDRDRHFVAAALGVLEAGSMYLPLDPAMPLDRRSHLLTLAGAPVVISQVSLAGDLHRLQWRSPTVTDVLCVDCDDLDGIVEPAGAMMSAELWDHLAGDDANDIAAGGWKSAFTGLLMPPAALAAFSANARAKAEPLLRVGGRVLEIGCASGFTMRGVAPLAASYVAADLSRRNVERAETYARQHGLDHVSGRHLAAHDIDVFLPGSFDLIILNSLVENFPGFGYLRQVLAKAVKLLATEGALYLGSIWDLERLDRYRADLAAFARAHAGMGYQTRLDFIEDLFVPRAFFTDWAAEQPIPPALEFSAIDAPGFDPASYGYDLVIRPGQGLPSAPRKRRAGRRALDGQPPGPPPVEVAPHQAAYVIFTSGSTGEPKGVTIEHHSVVNLANHVAETLFAPLGPEAGLRVSCISSFVFDASVKQVFATLLNGHSLVIPSEQTRREPRPLVAFLDSRRVDLCDTTPSLFALLVDHWIATGEATRARLFILGGEVVQASLLRRFYDIPGHGNVRVVNAYGPTECCVAASQHIMTAADWTAVLPPPIGLPIGGVEVQLRDAAGRRVPRGIPGEIWIGGSGVGRGYLRAPDLTTERFVTEAGGRRWYRTGDLGRWLPGGLLAFLGREDRQVKIRGNRIELAEVEAALSAHPLVRQAVAVAVDPHQDGNRLLAAYLVPRPGFELAACKADLDARLPPYMVPSWLIPVDQIPLTPNGKVDESRLPPLAASNAGAPTGRPLDTDVERRLAGVWSRILDTPVEDAEADFFTLGGHSVLAVRLMSEIERTFGVHLPLADLFACPTVAKLAARMAETSRRQAWHPVVSIHPEGSATPIVCFHPVGGNVLCYQGLAEALGPGRPLYLVQAYGLEQGQRLLPTVEEMVASYLEPLRATLSDRPLILAGWSFGGVLAFEAAHRLRQAGARLEAVILLDSVAVADPIRDMLRQDEAGYLADLFSELGLVTAEELRRLTPEARLDLLVERGRGSALLPDHTDRAGMRRLLAVFQNNALAAVRYHPRPMDGRVLLVRPRIPTRSAPGIAGDDLNGWGPLARGGVELRWIEGTHGEMLLPPSVFALAAHLGAFLGEQSIPPEA